MKKWNAPVVEELAVNETAEKNGWVMTPEGMMNKGQAKKKYPNLFNANGEYIGEIPDDDVNGAS